MLKAWNTVNRVLHTEIPITRKGFLTAVGGFAVGAPAGAAGGYLLRPGGAPGESRSFSQAGEDAAVWFFLQYVGLSNPITYLDIGANDPVKNNNTYLFYKMGGRGVLVEPNIAHCEQLRAQRPRDTTLNAGIGVSAAKEADFYVMTDPSWNTFSREEAEHVEKITNKTMRIKSVIKMPLMNINDVMERHFDGAPKFVSIDAEGLHLAILKSLDFNRFRPPVICVETLVSGSRATIAEIPEFMAGKGYVARGGSFVNTLFVDSKYT